MNVLEYMTKQSIIVKEATGVTLTPDSQLLNLDITNNMLKDMQDYIDSLAIKPYAHSLLVWENSPYCSLFYKDRVNSCEECPVYLEGNQCEKDDSTYEQAVKIIKSEGFDDTVLREKLLQLAKEFLDKNKLRKGKALGIYE